jgi:hypothetical protein
MIRFYKHFSTPVLVGLVVLASSLPEAYGQGRAMHLRSSLPARPFMVNGTAMHLRTPFRTMHHATPFRTINRATPALSRRDPRFDPFLRRDLRFDRALRAGTFGFSFGGTPFVSPFASLGGASFGVGGLSGGVIGSSGLTAYPVPYPVYSNPYGDFTNPYNFSGGAGGNESLDGSSVDAQSPGLLQEKVRAERLANRRKLFDENLYERALTPTLEEERQRSLREQLSRSLHNPPVNEIWSGQALNTLVADLAVKLGSETEGPGASIPLDSGVLRHLNFTRSPGHGNPGLFKDEGRLSWPPTLTDKLYRANRDLLNHLAPVLYAQAVAGRVDPGTLQQVTETAQQLRRQVTGKIRDMTPAQYGEARRFLVDLEDALKLLGRPDAGTYFAAGAAQGTTVGQLVTHLVRNGWSFAPAVAGDEGAYVAAHRVLVAYELAVSKVSTSETATK